MILKLIKIHRYEAGLYFHDGEFRGLLEAGRHWFLDPLRRVRVEVVDARAVRFVHPDLAVIAKAQMVHQVLDAYQVAAGHVGAWFKDGSFVETLPAGRYMFWKSIADIKLVPVDTRELILDVAGQEIMTADKVTLRLNALVTYRVIDARLSCSATRD